MSFVYSSSINMKYFLILFIFSLSHPTASDDDDIVKPENDGWFFRKIIPHMVIIQKTDFQDHGMCSGVVVDKMFVLTAAQCVSSIQCSNIEIFRDNRTEQMISDDQCETSVQNTKFLHIFAGISPERIASLKFVKEIYIHPDFSFYNNEYACFHMYDIALLKLSTPLEFSADISSVTLVDEEERLNMQLECLTLGWMKPPTEMNYARSYILRLSKVQVYPWYNCSLSFCRRTGICSENLDSVYCTGFHGGPLMCNKKLFGLASMSKLYNGGCEMNQLYFTRVKPALDWIKKVISES